MAYSIIAVIYNPNSTGPSRDMAINFVNEVKTRLPEQKVELIATEHAGHAEELAYKIAQEYSQPLIVSSSGDGGYNEVVNGALKAQNEGRSVATGLLPAGNANDHHRNLHEHDFVDQVVSGEVKQIDVLKIESTCDNQPIARYAHSYIGIGLTPKAGKELNKTKLNPMKEIILAARVLFFAKPTKLKIGNKTRRYDSVIFSNIESMSKYLGIAQSASVTDGKFEVTIFRRRNRLKLIGILLKATLTGLKEDMTVAQFKLQTVTKTLVQTDGEIITCDANVTVMITVQKQTLRCIV